MKLSDIDIKEGMKLRIVPMTHQEYCEAVAFGMRGVGYVDIMRREDYVITVIQRIDGGVVASDGYCYALEQLEPLIQEYEVL